MVVFACEPRRPLQTMSTHGLKGVALSPCIRENRWIDGTRMRAATTGQRICIFNQLRGCDT